MKKIIIAFIVSLCVLIHFSLGLYAMQGDSAIVDELAHIPAGYSYVTLHDYRLNPEHPPLLKILSGLSLSTQDLHFDTNEKSWSQDINGQWESGWSFLYHQGNDPDVILFYARLPFLVISSLFVLLFFFITRYLVGVRAAVLGTVLLAFSPTLLGHNHFVTTDVGVAILTFLSLFSVCYSLEKKTRVSFAVSALITGLALSAKFSAFLILPVIFLAYTVFTVRDVVAQKEKVHIKKVLYVLLKRAGELIVFMALAYTVVWLVYVFAMYNMPADKIQELVTVAIPSKGLLQELLLRFSSNPVLKYFVQYVVGFIMVLHRVDGGNTTFLLGNVTNQSFKWYFPFAFIVKETVGFLVLFALTILVFTRSVSWNKLVSRFSSGRKAADWIIYTIKSLDVSQLFTISSIVFVFIYLYFSITGNLNIGIRHLMPVLPFLYFITAKQISIWLGSRFSWRTIFVGLCIIGTVSSVIISAPYYLAYFNELSGGRNSGYKLLTDSNLDWGQDLVRLKKFMNDNNIPKIKLDYFGGGLPEHYLGTSYEKWSSQKGETSGWVGVSATYLQNSRWYHIHNNEPDYDWLRSKKPFTIIGGSILIYYIP
ncbi:MAG: glycosyltransferase family 39 protein [Patescibacteria group bacterium]